MNERNCAILVRLTAKEKESLFNKSKICGLKMEPYVRSLIMGNEVKPRPPDEYVRVARELNAIGNNVNQFAHIANATQTVTQEQITGIMELLNDAIRTMRSIR